MRTDPLVYFVSLPLKKSEDRQMVFLGGLEWVLSSSAETAYVFTVYP